SGPSPYSRARERTSRPDTSGIRMSTSARSKGRERNAASASAPLGTVTTVWPLCEQARSSTQRIDSSSSATRMVPGRSASGVDMLLTHGKGDGESGAPAGARLMGGDAAVLGDDAGTDGESEAGPARLGGEEGREEVALHVLGHAWAVVRDRDREELVAMRAAAHVIAGLDAGRDGELATAAEGLDGVAHEVQEHLGQLHPVAADRGQARIELGAQRDGSPVRRLVLEGEDVVQNAVDVLRREMEVGRGAEALQLLDEPVQAIDLPDDHVGGLDVSRIGQVGAEQLGRALDPAEGIADLVGEPEGDAAQRCQLIGTAGGGVEGALEG